MMEQYPKCNSKYQSYSLHFLNRVGGYDTMKFSLVNKRNTEYEKSYFTRDIKVVDELLLNDEIEGFVKNYVDELDKKNIAREERLLKRNVNKYNL